MLLDYLLRMYVVMIVLKYTLLNNMSDLISRINEKINSDAFHIHDYIMSVVTITLFALLANVLGKWILFGEIEDIDRACENIVYSVQVRLFG